MAQYVNDFYTPAFSTPKDLCKQELKEFVGHKDEVNCVSYSSDFQFMVTGSDDQRVRVFKVKTKQCLVKLKGHEGAIRSVAVSPCDKYFASGSYDKTARVWRTANGECVHVLAGHNKSIEEVVFSPGSIYLCTASWDRTAILWNLKEGCMVKRFEGHEHSVQSVAFSYDFLMLATGSWDFNVRVWKMDHTEYKRVLQEHVEQLDGAFDYEENQEIDDERHRETSKNDVTIKDVDEREKLEKNSDASQKYKKGNRDDNVDDRKNKNNNDDTGENTDVKEKCDETSDESQKTKKEDNVDDRKSACSIKTDMFDEGGCLVLTGHVGNVDAVAFSKFGMLASGSWDRTVRLWNPNTGWCLRLLLGHEGWVKAVTFSPDSTYVASAADDDSVKVWDIPSGKCIKSFEASTDLAQHCAFTPDGVLVASGAAVMEEKVPLKKDRQEEEEEVESLLKLKQLPRGILKSAASAVRRETLPSAVRRDIVTSGSSRKKRQCWVE